MRWDLRSLLAGLFFLACTTFCAITIVQGGRQSYLFVGVFIFTIVGLGFIKKAKR